MPLKWMVAPSWARVPPAIVPETASVPALASSVPPLSDRLPDSASVALGSFRVRAATLTWPSSVTAAAPLPLMTAVSPLPGTVPPDHSAPVLKSPVPPCQIMLVIAVPRPPLRPPGTRQRRRQTRGPRKPCQPATKPDAEW